MVEKNLARIGDLYDDMTGGKRGVGRILSFFTASGAVALGVITSQGLTDAVVNRTAFREDLVRIGVPALGALFMLATIPMHDSLVLTVFQFSLAFGMGIFSVLQTVSHGLGSGSARVTEPNRSMREIRRAGSRQAKRNGLKPAG